MSTLFVNNLNTASGTDITVASGKTIKAPGMVVQVQSGQCITQTTLSSNRATYTDVGLSVTITPKYANSKIYVNVTGNGYASSSTDNPLHKIVRTVSGSATTIASTDYMMYGSPDGNGGAYCQSVMDTAQSTAAHEYKIQMRSDKDTGNVYFNVNDSSNAAPAANESMLSTIMVMEIAQ